MTWKPLPIGSGGQLSGIDIASDGTMAVRADTYGAYRWDATAASPGNAGGLGVWTQLFTENSIPSPAVSDPFSYVYATYEIRIAPSNTSRFYMYNNLSIYTTTNKGASWTKTGFNNGLTVAAADGSDGYTKFFGPFLAIDPFNELICYTGTPGHAYGSPTAAQGVFYTTDGGGSWTPISTSTIAAGTTIPSGSAQDGGNLIAFDPTSSHPGTPPVTQIIYISSYGTGVYKSTNGGSSWALLNSAGMPTTVGKMLVGPDSNLYCTDATGSSNLIVYDGTWHTYSTGSKNIQTMAFDPGNSSHLVAVSADGTMSTTAAGPTTGWSGYNDAPYAVRSATDIPWLGEAYGQFMTAAMCAFDPSQSNVLYLAAGVGVWKTSDTTVSAFNTVVNWASRSVGIEQLVASWVISPPNGNPLVACFDRPIFTITDKTKYPTAYGPSYPGSVFEGFSADWASTNPSAIVVLTNEGVATSSNGGGITGGPSNWSYVTNQPASPPGGGAIASASPTNFVSTVLFNGVYYTLNGGSSAWLSPTFTGVTSADAGFYSFSRNIRLENICADRVLPNTFYLYNNGTTGPGMYVSTDGGANFTKKFTGHVDATDGFGFQMKSVPGQSGRFYSSAGATAFSNTPGFDEWIWNGSTLTQNRISGVLTVWAFGFGKAKSTSNYPSVYVYGKVNGVIGLFRSDDHCVTWTQLSNAFIPDWPVSGSTLGTADQVATIEGDSNTYGLVYVGFNGSGFALGSFPEPVGGRGGHGKFKLNFH